MVEDHFQESEPHYQRLIEAIPDAVVVYDNQGNFLYANQNFLEIYGWSKEELLGRPVDFVPRDELERTREALARTLRGEPVVFETKRLTKSGRMLFSQLRTSILRDAEGVHVATVVIHRDITELKKTEEELRKYRHRLEELVELRTHELKESEQRYRLVLNASPDPISVYDHQGKITYLNPAFEQTFGWTLEELTGQGIDFVPPYEAEKTRQAVLRTLEGENVLLETQRLTKTGQLLDIQLKTAIFTDPQGNLAGDIVIYRDISERKRAERELQKAKEAAEAANRAKSVFLANMSHELRTPLNAILGFSQLMWRDATLNPAHRERLGIINRSGEHLLALINDVLEMSKIEAGRMVLNKQTFDLRHTLLDLEAMIRPPAEDKNLELHVECSPELPRHFKTDPYKLRQILINLLDNAVKFTSRGAIGLSAWAAMQDGTQILHIEVRDNGAGMAQEELDTIFDVFVRTPSAIQSASGTGLGLAISRRFAQLLGGDLTVKSQVGKGSVFKLQIPVEPPDLDQLPTARRDSRNLQVEPNRQDHRILVVEDNFENRTLLCTILRQAGFEVREAINGQEGVDRFKKWHPHMIFMDMRMPVMDGFEAMRRIKAHSQGIDTYVVAVTAHALEEERAAILEAGCDDFLPKPFRDEDIFDILSKHLEVRLVNPDQNSGPEIKNLDESSLRADTLDQLPAGWIEELRKAAEILDAETAKGLIEKVRSRNVDLAEKLSILLKSYRFDKLQQWLGTSEK